MVPFGLPSSPTMFMCLMNNIFSKYFDKFFIFILLRDILVYCKNEEEHKENLRLVF